MQNQRNLTLKIPIFVPIGREKKTKCSYFEMFYFTLIGAIGKMKGSL